MELEEIELQEPETQQPEPPSKKKVLYDAVSKKNMIWVLMMNLKQN